MPLDLLLVNPGNRSLIYQGLGDSLTAVEPPMWCRLIAGYVRDRGYGVAIHDYDAGEPFPAADDVRLIAIVAFGHQPSASTQQMADIGKLILGVKSSHPGAKVILVGGHVSALTRRTMEEEPCDYACTGEGPETILGLLEGKPEEEIPGLAWRDGGEIVINAPAKKIADLDADLHGNTWDLLPMQAYRAHSWQVMDGSPRQPYAAIYTSLGCPYACLTGDTPVNTIYGDIPIKDLAEHYGDKGVPVYTYDPETREAFISDSVMVRKYETDAELVRVHFDDGTHIDCTPDHRFLQFKWGNGKSLGKQWECEARDLPAGAHVRAVKFYKDAAGYTVASWGRRDRRHRARMVMDYLLGRKMSREEQVHHRDHSRSNDHPDNLEYCASSADHHKHHPEVAERMRANNPTKGGISEEWKDNIAAANRGKVRSQESRQRYRESKLGEKNPNYRHGQTAGRVSRLAEVNHKVTHVEWLAERGDVYCLTVPKTGWFFANNVLVKNCSFCCINAPFGGKSYRTRSPEAVVAEVEMLYREHGVRTFKIIDEMFVLKPSHYLPTCEGLAALPFADELNIWAYARIDTVKPETLATLRRAGIRWLALGIESGSAHVRDGAKKSLGDSEIRDIVLEIQRCGINVLGNFIFGLPDDTHETMQATLDLALSLNLDFANYYSAMAYPGSALFDLARPEDLPERWSGYSQHSFDTKPLPTEALTSEQVLAFRDQAFRQYFTDPRYLGHVKRKFGEAAVAEIEAMTAQELPRALVA